MLVGAVAIVLLITAIFTVPGYLTNRNLKALGYTSSQISAIKKNDLTDVILDNEYYSEYLAQCIEDGTVNENYLALYAALDTDADITADDLLLYSRLEDMGYETDQLQNLFQNLEFWEMTPLLLFDYQYNETTYIEDCIANRETNSESYFSLSGSYWTAYSRTRTIEDSTSVSVLVSKRYLLSSTDIPSDLTTLDTTYSISDMQLRSEAASAFLQFASAASANGYPIYAVLAYRSYEDQESAYNNLVTYYGEDYASTYAAQAGASDHQTGLAVNVSVVGEESSDFDQTASGQWAIANCTTYGFILRYPDNKSYITGFSYESSHFRYVGVELAQAVSASQLTYDEFFALYLASWNEDTYIPDDSVLNNASYTVTSTVLDTSSASTSEATASAES